MDIQTELDYKLPEYFYTKDPESARKDIRTLIMKGALLTEEIIGQYKYMDSNNRSVPLLEMMDECYDQLQQNRQLQCDHTVFSEDSYCVDCGISYSDFKDTCKHIWAPAGHKKNTDRIHNKGNGKGKYQAYKCQTCGKFKRRFLK